MASSQDLSFYPTMPLTTFDQLGQLLQQIGQGVQEGVVLTESILSPIPIPPGQIEKFSLVVSQKFSALLAGTLTERGSGLGEQPSVMNVRLTFAPEAIANFLIQLSESRSFDPQTYQALNSYSRIPQSNDAKLQSEFTLLLVSLLVCQQNFEPTYPDVSVCQPVENALRQQIAHERILNQVTTQIRQSMELPVILTTALNQVREFLQVDRLVIYQFEESGDRRQETENRRQETGMFIFPSSPATEAHSAHFPSFDLLQHSGLVAYESRATESIPSVLNYKEENCFLPTSECWEKYRQGFTLAIDDVETGYVLSKCLLGFLRATKIRAKLAAPIVLQDKLWGLVIAHQCTAPRHWLDSEKNLLKRIAEQLAIAIYQAELMQQREQEKRTLEQRVIERTQALHDALIAAQAASRAKSEFLATMSHELRSPLTRIIGMSSTLLRWPLGELNQRQQRYLHIIHDSGQHLLTLINDILELSQLEAGKAILNINEFSLVQLAQASVCSHNISCGESLCERAKHQAINLKLDLKIEPPSFRFAADPQRVRQIIWNLVSNAVKFTPEGGQVILRAWLENNTAVFQVEDTGIGIPEHQIPLLFEFQQLESPHCRLYEGTGLGLALTKQLVELHRGRIEVKSTLGIGSTFTVWLPAIANYKV